jgi:hypothetical protein
LLRVVTAHLAWLFHARPMPANRLTRGPVLRPALYDRLCRLEEAYPLARDRLPLDLFLGLAPGPPPRERQHELAAVCSSGFRL